MNGVRVVISIISKDARKKISSVLQSSGYLVIGETDNGPGALRLIQALQPDIVLIDIDNPQGLSAAQILEEEGRVGLILIGTHPIRENLNVLSGQILKPVSDLALLTAVDFVASSQMRIQKMTDEISKLRNMLATRKLVEKAKGLLMKTLGITEAEAYRRIQQQSMNKRVSIQKIAEAIVTFYELEEK